MTVPDRLPEPVRDLVTVDVLQQRVRALRAAYDAGTLAAPQFNRILEYFQFTDPEGNCWAPGATTFTWYRWNGAAWEAAEPPAQLALPSELRDAPWEAVAPASGIAAVTCSRCGAAAAHADARFCEQCGAAL